MINKIIKEFIDNASFGMALFDAEEKLSTANNALVRILGVELKEIKGMSVTRFIEKFFQPANKPYLCFDCKSNEKVFIGKRGSSFYAIQCFYVSNILSKPYFLLSVVDISNFKEHEEPTENTKVSIIITSIVEFIPDILFAINKQGQVIVWNRAAEEMTGIPKKQILGKGNYEYAIPFYGERRPILIDFALRGEKPKKGFGYKSIKYSNGTITAISERAYLKNRKRILWGKASRFYDLNGNTMGAIEIVRDITEMKKMEMKLKYMAERDSLTNAFNRRQFETLLEHEIERSERTKEPISLIYIDVDNLKKINDSLGHRKGDEVLIKITKALRDGLRKSDIVARVGGDEFVIVMPGLRKDDARKLIDRLRNKIAEENKDFPHNIDFSYGIVEITPDKTAKSENAISNADKEMYKMKRLKKQG